MRALAVVLALQVPLSAVGKFLRHDGAVVKRHHVMCFEGTSSALCDVLMESVTKERETEQKVHQTEVTNANHTASKLPGDGAPPDWWQAGEDPEVMPERLRGDCEEPEDPPQTVGGFGPEKIYCCHTAQTLVADLNERKEHCDSTPPVDCWESLKTVLPNYISYFTKRRDWLCRTTTTTTTTITTTPTTTTLALVKANETANETKAEKPKEDPLQWCYDLCDEHGGDTVSCKKLCKEIAKRMIHKKECEDEIQEALEEHGVEQKAVEQKAMAPAPNPVN